MSFDLEKMQAYAELGEVIRLQNEAMDKLAAFRKARPTMVMPNLAKMVEENMKENVQVLYKELNNLHKPAEQQTRYICNDCKMAFLVPLPGGICDECRANKPTSAQPRAYVPYRGDDDTDAEEPDGADAAQEESDEAADVTNEQTDAGQAAESTTTPDNELPEQTADATDSAEDKPATETETDADTPAPENSDDKPDDKPSDEFEKFFSINPSEDGEK